MKPIATDSQHAGLLLRLDNDEELAPLQPHAVKIRKHQKDSDVGVTDAQPAGKGKRDDS